ncbi:MAG TPA: aldo/keto reductase, partial [Thermomicrobiales bacterium]|nr:aldo/keto reductase [Thermomicrobiales bacterium]
MTFDPFALNQIGARVGFGTTGISRDDMSDEAAAETFRTAWESGVRYFDTAPMYGSGVAEVRTGRALAGIPRDDYVLSTKVGRLVKGAPDVRSAGTDWYYDFSADGIKRSIAESLERLQLDRVDILYIHDADDYVDQAVAEAWPVIEQLRSEGVVRAVGAGNTTVPTLLRFARETTMDFFLVAGRYTMLADDAQDELLPLCIEKGIGVVIAQALHGGLIDGVADPQLYYQPTDDATKAKV